MPDAGTRPRPILSTYRLQLSPELDFAAVAELVGYLADLGVSHLYLSPLLTARAGSSHGYDVVDPTTVSPALGGEEGLRALADTAHAAGLGLVVDIVPNHLGTGAGNRLWESLLAQGQGGEGARFFDVDWNPPLPGAAGKVILPVLGDQYGAALHRGELRLTEEDGDVVRLRYHEHSFPLSPETEEALSRSGGVEALNGEPGQPESWQRLHALLETQHYRLVHWRIGDAVVNYRRFFAINDLAAVRVEDDVVFDNIHGKVLELVADGVIDGLRVDHPDGLRDPRRYLERLSQRSGAWTVVEKVLHPNEPLPDWPVAGTTGYDFCNDVLGLFVDPAAEQAFSELAYGQDGDDFDWWAWDSRDDVLDADLSADVLRLSQWLWVLTQQDLQARDVSWSDALTAVWATLCEFDVYRTYVDPQTGEVSERDAEVLRRVFDSCEEWLAGVAGQPLAALAALRRVLLGAAADSPESLDFVARFQQLSSAVMAKGVEDTAFYRDRRLLALNEVGGDPRRFGITAERFHTANTERSRRHPAGMVTTATHDTKRGEDVRLRIAALTELGDRWPRAVAAWRSRGWLADRGADVLGRRPTDTLDLVCQTLLGVWPLDGEVTPGLVGRVKSYLTKALREAGQATGWVDRNEQFERDVHAAVDAMLADGAFVDEIGRIATAAGEIAMASGLAQVLLRCSAPGVADTYQGNELWDDSLVDPDNRRPVDFARRRRLLADLDGDDVDPARLWASRRDGRVKLWVLSRALRARRRHPEIVGAGYEPLDVAGRWADRVVAFARRQAGLVTVVPRLPGAVMAAGGRDPLGGAWEDTSVALPPAEWTDLLTGSVADGGRTRVGELLHTLPVALLEA